MKTINQHVELNSTQIRIKDDAAHPTEDGDMPPDVAVSQQPTHDWWSKQASDACAYETNTCSRTKISMKVSALNSTVSLGIDENSPNLVYVASC